MPEADFPNRVPPEVNADGEFINPPASGRWLRDADGGLTPADQATAERAGLAWPAPAATDAPKE